MLFQTDFPRTGGPATPRESNFEYLQRSNRPEAVQRCQWIEDLLDEFPSSIKPSLTSRLKNRNFQTFSSALFELQCHSILKSLNLSLEVEPKLQGTCKKIDFLAYPLADKDRCFYIEATVSGINRGILRSDPNEYDAVQRIKRGIQKIPNHHSDVWLETEGTLPGNLPRKHVQHIVEKFAELLNCCTADAVRQYGRIYIRPIKPYEDSDWTLSGHLSPCINPSGVGQIYGPGGGGAVNGSRSLLTSLKDKADHWSKFDFAGHPFIVAVNACDSEFFWTTNDPIDIRRALFDNPNHTEQSMEFRKELRCISGVVVVGNAVLGNEYGAKVQLFRNGNADIPECLHFLFEEQRLEVLLGLQGNVGSVQANFQIPLSALFGKTLPSPDAEPVSDAKQASETGSTTP